MQLYWVYITGWATPEGIVQFRDDIYQRDGLGAIAAYQAAPGGGGAGPGVQPQPKVQPVRAQQGGGGGRLQPMNDDED